MKKICVVIGAALIVTLFFTGIKIVDDMKNTSAIFRAEKIDKYFSDRGMPLSGFGKYMVSVAEKYAIDWRLIPALAIRESSGGKYLIAKNNPFGWGSADRIEFESMERSIDTVAMALGSGRMYRGKDLREKLETYNPPSVAPHYADEVIDIMENIHSNSL
jgi:hypothetical protein